MVRRSLNYVKDVSRTVLYGPVGARSTYEQTVERLGTAIRLGVLGPGDRLPPERELADQLDISRSTLRQALATLTGTGHLVAVRGRAGGTFVAEDPPLSSGLPVALENSRALLDWRTALELGTVQLAAERATPEQREALVAEAAGNGTRTWAEFRRADARFHLQIAEAAHSERLVAAMTRVHGELSDLLTQLGCKPATRDVTPGQHQEVAAAVARGDAEGAREAMRTHLAGTEQTLDGVLP